MDQRNGAWISDTGADAWEEDEDIEVERRAASDGLAGLEDAVTVAALALWRAAGA